MRASTTGRFGFAARCLALVALAVAAGCGSGEDHAPIGGSGTLPPGGLPSCGTETGCPCDHPGQVVDCKVYRRSGDYVACSTGQRVCGDDGRWGDCTGGDQVAK